MGIDEKCKRPQCVEGSLVHWTWAMLGPARSVVGDAVHDTGLMEIDEVLCWNVEYQ